MKRGSATVMWALAALQCARLAWIGYQRALVPRFLPRKVEPLARAWPSVSIVIPARNEAATIGACLDGARAQDYPRLEIVVVDDQSEDGTAEIVRRAAAADVRVQLVEGAPLPPGWKGKAWALHQGAGAASGDWLLFVDADTRLLPGAVTGAIAAATASGAAVLSAMTAQALPTWWERVLQPAIIAAIAESMPVSLVNDPRNPQYAMANGQFLLFRRDAYQAIGGHAAVRAEIAEDTHLARRVKQAGIAYLLGDGRALARTRMYPTPAALWEGWTKNLHAGIWLLPWQVPLGIVFLIASLVAPFWCFYQARHSARRAPAAAGAIQLAASLAIRGLMDRLLGVPPVYTLTQPIGQLAFLVLLSASFYRVASGRGVTWKGRRYRS